MAHLWLTCRGDDVWDILPLETGSRYRLTGSSAHPVARASAGASGGCAVLMSHKGPRGAEWVLLSSQGAYAARVNGTLHGVKMLADRDEVRVNRTRLFFSSEALAQVEPFPGADGHAGKCPRCNAGFDVGQLSVRCPKCGVWSHQFDGRNCWTYAAGCASCGHPTALDAGFAWTPAALG